MNKLLIIISFFIFLTGCSSIINPYNETYLCNGKTGFGKCASMNQAYKESCQNELAMENSSEDVMRRSYVVSYKKKPSYKKAEPIRVLILDYVDENGYYYSPRYVWFFRNGAKWDTISNEVK